MAARSKARKAAPRKRTIDWYRKGLADARKYWAAMAAGGEEREDNHIHGYLKYLADLPEEEELDVSTVGFYMQGLAEGLHKRIDDLLHCATVLDSVATVGRALSKRWKPLQVAKRWTTAARLNA